MCKQSSIPLLIVISRQWVRMVHIQERSLINLKELDPALASNFITSNGSL